MWDHIHIRNLTDVGKDIRVIGTATIVDNHNCLMTAILKLFDDIYQDRSRLVRRNQYNGGYTRLRRLTGSERFAGIGRQ